MKRNKKLLGILLSFILTLCTIFTSLPIRVEAAASAKSLVESALKYSKKFDNISYYSVEKSFRDNRRIVCVIIGQCDKNISHNIRIQDDQNTGGFEEYYYKAKYYRKSSSESDKWNSYVNEYDKKASYQTNKGMLEYILANATSAKIKSKSSDNFVITCKLQDEKIKSITLTIDKDTKSVTKCSISYKTYTGMYLNNGGRFTVKNKVLTLSNIAYGKGKVKLPSGL